MRTDELCGVCERPLGGALTACPHCGTKFAAPAPQEAEPPTMQVRAEALWEELGGDLCVCQRADVLHWCEGCLRKIQLIRKAFARAASHADAWREKEPDYKALYHELIYQVVNVTPGETRHESAKRIIHQHENQPLGGPQSASPEPEGAPKA